MDTSGGIMGVKIKLMPTSPDVDLVKIKGDCKSYVEENGGLNREYEEEPIAFGLKAVIAFFEWPEKKDLDEVEAHFGKIENVQSVQIIDLRKIA